MADTKKKIDFGKKISKIATAKESTFVKEVTSFFVAIANVNFEDGNELDLIKGVNVAALMNKKFKKNLNLIQEKILTFAEHCYKNSRFYLANASLLLLDSYCDCHEVVILKSKIFSICGKFDEASKIIKNKFDSAKNDEIKLQLLEVFGELLSADNSLSLEDKQKERMFFLEKYQSSYSKVSLQACFFAGKLYCEEFSTTGEEKYINFAIECFNNVITMTNHPNTNPLKILRIKTYWCLGKLYIIKYHKFSDNEENKGKNATAALEKYKAATSLAAENKFPVWKEISLSYETVASNLTKSKDGTPQTRSGKIMLSSDMFNIEKSYYNNESSRRRRFIRETHRLEEEEYPLLHVLQRWNSFTPILGDANAPSKGGGYYLKYGRKGIVIDPGFDFIKNFSEAGYTLNDIDYIFISHAHNDHTADLESITSLLHDYNEKEILGDKFSIHRPNSIYQQLLHDNPEDDAEDKPNKDKNKPKILGLESKVKAEFARSPRRKKINIAITRSTDKKYSFLNFDSNSDLEMISLATTPLSKKMARLTEIEIESCAKTKKLSCGTIYSKHNDQISQDHCVGFFFYFSGTETMLIYTGDTAYDKTVKMVYESVDQVVKGIKDKILLAHIGGFKHHEKHYELVDGIVPENAYYKTHLGRHGLVALAEVVKPKLCIISEFGEEFKGNRENFANLYNRAFDDHIPAIKFIPADIGLKVNFNLEIESDRMVFLPLDQVEFKELNSMEDIISLDNASEVDIDSIRYYKK